MRTSAINTVNGRLRDVWSRSPGCRDRAEGVRESWPDLALALDRLCELVDEDEDAWVERMPRPPGWMRGPGVS